LPTQIAPAPRIDQNGGAPSQTPYASRKPVRDSAAAVGCLDVEQILDREGQPASGPSVLSWNAAGL